MPCSTSCAERPAIAPALVIVGPTASGKSDLALAVARAAGDAEVLAADSMQVYRGMDIGTAKPTAAEQREIRHHLLDVVEPHETFSMSDYQRLATAALEDIAARGRRAIIVGGTGLYVQALVDGLTIPPQYPAVRSRLEAEADAGPDAVAALHRRLAQLDPVAAARMEPTNRRRIVRALEVTLGSGRPFSGFGPGVDHYPSTRHHLVGLDLDRSALDARIEARYHRQLADGFLDEVRALAARPEGLSHTAAQALGYKELLAHVHGTATLEEALQLAVVRTRRFARRQQRWFRRDPRLRWTDAVAAADNPLAVATALLGDWTAS
ncbi:MAG: tRNA (adenosine(37)-N6)-dimethylallyltransferase MiaA [Acidimicrobiia bacterium]